MLKLILTSIVLTVLIASGLGCSKEEAVQGPAVAPSAPPPPNLPPVVNQAGQIDMDELNRTLVRWVLRNQRRPNSYEDFAATAGVQLPTPPAGKKFVISKDMKIAIVNR